MPYQYPFFNAPDYLKLAVWTKGRVIPEYDSAIWRWDACGHVMNYSEHGNTNSEHGWEIDHMLPSAKGGSNALENLQPLYWQNNRRKGDTYPWFCDNAA